MDIIRFTVEDIDVVEMRANRTSIYTVLDVYDNLNANRNINANDSVSANGPMNANGNLNLTGELNFVGENVQVAAGDNLEILFRL